MIDRQKYLEDLSRRQREHLDRVFTRRGNWQPCMHDACPRCFGTGIRENGSLCIHAISCPCPKCTPISM